MYGYMCLQQSFAPGATVIDWSSSCKLLIFIMLFLLEVFFIDQYAPCYACFLWNDDCTQ